MIALALQIAVAFNLSCSGTNRIWGGSLPATQTPWSTVLRISLEDMRWCSAECRETEPIVSVSPTQIVLISDPEIQTRFSINRESGLLAYYMRGADLGFLISATCERSDFTGFPARRF